MARICVLEAIAGADFSWAAGDIVDLPAQEAARWADGHRAVLLDDDGGQQAPATGAPAHQLPLVVGDDGQRLEVVAAAIEETEPPQGQAEGAGWVRWSVTVRLPVPAPADSAPDGAPDVGEGQGKEAAGLFDPRQHTNKEVLAYLDTASYEEAVRVLDAEANEGENRAGIGKQREQLLEAARLREGRQTDTEKAADASRGGGRAPQAETRNW
ncbi:hypothetical protein AB0I84_05860 [Streptomyces spectabilis]|uniref:hypothetical protein n=1 Tax=Streptomyces spectabilis TaxID=68270 RepID=UPI0033CA3F12